MHLLWAHLQWCRFLCWRDCWRPDSNMDHLLTCNSFEPTKTELDDWRMQNRPQTDWIQLKRKNVRSVHFERYVISSISEKQWQLGRRETYRKIRTVYWSSMIILVYKTAVVVNMLLPNSQLMVKFTTWSQQVTLITESVFISELSSVTGSNLKAAVHPKERDWKENKIEHLMIDELRNSFRLLGSHWSAHNSFCGSQTDENKCLQMYFITMSFCSKHTVKVY